MSEKDKKTVEETDESINEVEMDQVEVDPQMADAQLELQELKDKYLRLVAEFDNYRKRTALERNELHRTAAEGTIKKFLPILDDFDRAKTAADDDSTDEVFTEGVRLVYEKIHSTLKGMGVTEMDMADGSFNGEFHEAITEIPVPDEEQKGKIVDVIEKGYLLHDKIMRYAKVVVGR